jgi:hypothetical protein
MTQHFSGLVFEDGFRDDGPQTGNDLAGVRGANDSSSGNDHVGSGLQKKKTMNDQGPML